MHYNIVISYNQLLYFLKALERTIYFVLYLQTI